MSKMIAPTGEGISLSKSVAETSKSANTIQSTNQTLALKIAEVALAEASKSLFQVKTILRAIDRDKLCATNQALLDAMLTIVRNSETSIDVAIDRVEDLTGGDHA